MGIGRKATDQCTPCRKFLPTPLLHTVVAQRRALDVFSGICLSTR